MVRKVTADLEQPSRRTVEVLFRDLMQTGRWNADDPLYQTYRMLSEAVDARREELMKDVSLVALVQERDQARSELCRINLEIKNRVAKVRKNYLARGLTPAVVKQVQDLVDWVNGLEG